MKTPSNSPSRGRTWHRGRFFDFFFVKQNTKHIFALL